MTPDPNSLMVGLDDRVRSWDLILDGIKQRVPGVRIVSELLLSSPILVRVVDPRDAEALREVQGVVSVEPDVSAFIRTMQESYGG